MNTTTSLFEEHTTNTNNIVSQYLVRFKNNSKSSADFLIEIIDEFRERIIEMGSITLQKSITEGVEPVKGESYYELVASIKQINIQASQNLLIALQQITKPN